LYLVFVGLAVMGLRAWTAADEAPGAMQRR
jgi:hypothetical protein